MKRTRRTPELIIRKLREAENARLKRAVADLTLDNQILEEASDYLGRPHRPRGGGAA